MASRMGLDGGPDRTQGVGLAGPRLSLCCVSASLIPAAGRCDGLVAFGNEIGLGIMSVDAYLRKGNPHGVAWQDVVAAGARAVKPENSHKLSFLRSACGL